MSSISSHSSPIPCTAAFRMSWVSPGSFLCLAMHFTRRSTDFAGLVWFFIKGYEMPFAKRCDINLFNSLRSLFIHDLRYYSNSTCQDSGWSRRTTTYFDIFCLFLLFSLSSVVSGYHSITLKLLWMEWCGRAGYYDYMINHMRIKPCPRHRHRLCFTAAHQWYDIQAQILLGLRYTVIMTHEKNQESWEVNIPRWLNWKWVSVTITIIHHHPSSSSSSSRGCADVGGWLWVQVMLPEELQRALLQLQGLGSRTYGVLAFKFQVDNSCCEGWLLDLNRFDELNLHQSLPDCSFIIVQSP